MNIGVLAVQGDFREHIRILHQLRIEAKEVRLLEDLENIAGLIIPGGESTVMGKLMKEYSLDTEIKKRHEEGMPIWGTCAGAILLAKKIKGSDQPRLGLVDITISRNHYGRQTESFEADIEMVNGLGRMTGIFIRAPLIEDIGEKVTILGKLYNNPVIARQGNVLVSTFHPELTENKKLHKYFLKMIKGVYLEKHKEFLKL